MTLTNARLVEKFVNGGTSGKANRMEIVEGPVEYKGQTVVPDGFTAIVAYGWAVYATRTDTGRVNIHWGWYDWGNEKRDGQAGLSTTEKHMRLLENKAGPTAILTERQPQSDSAPGSVNDICNPSRHYQGAY